MNNNLTLLTDFYELTMMYGYFKHGKVDEVATFDLFFRPFEESSFCIAAGLQQAIEYIENLNFSERDVAYLRSLNTFDEDFLSWLKNFKFTGSIKAVEEGWLPKEDLDKANYNRLLSLFRTKRVDNPYLDPDHADRVRAENFDGAKKRAYVANQKAVVLAKNVVTRG